MASRAFDPRQTQGFGERGTVGEPIPQNVIATHAYQLWQARGSPIGSPEIDWFQAERELRTRARDQPQAASEEPLAFPHSTGRAGATEDQVNTSRTVPERVDEHGSKVEDIAGTGEHDSLGG